MRFFEIIEQLSTLERLYLEELRLTKDEEDLIMIGNIMSIAEGKGDALCYDTGMEDIKNSYFSNKPQEKLIKNYEKLIETKNKFVAHSTLKMPTVI